MAKRLRLLAADGADLETVSALMQDAAIKAADIAYDAKARRLVILANRYRWEAQARTRVRTALRIEAITGLRRRNWPAGDVVLNLLALRGGDTRIEIDFAGGVSILAGVECIDVELHDLSRPWGARRTPRHDI